MPTFAEVKETIRKWNEEQTAQAGVMAEGMEDMVKPLTNMAPTAISETLSRGASIPRDLALRYLPEHKMTQELAAAVDRYAPSKDNASLLKDDRLAAVKEAVEEQEKQRQTK